jgi:hypothetical protein
LADFAVPLVPKHLRQSTSVCEATGEYSICDNNGIFAAVVPAAEAGQHGAPKVIANGETFHYFPNDVCIVQNRSG